MKSAGKYAARTALDTGGNILADVIDGKNLRESASANSKEVFEDMK